MSKIKDMKLRYKVVAGVATGAAVLGMAGGAFAYFGGGNGTGTGAASTSATAPTVSNLSATVSASDITYDGSTSDVSVTVNNPNPYSVAFKSLTVGVDDNKLPANCAKGSFLVDNSKATWTGAVGPGTVTVPGTEPVTGITIKFVDSQTGLQDGCVNSTVIPLTYTISGS